MHIEDLGYGLNYAIKLAAEAHVDQVRWDGRPYIEHPLRVAWLVRVAGGDAEAEITAVLHDVVEDHPVYAGELAVMYRNYPRILKALNLLTHDHGISEAEYLDYIKRLSADPIARAVKMADLQDNLRDLRDGKLRRKYEEAEFRLHAADLAARATLRDKALAAEHPDPMIRDQLLHEAPSA